MLRRLGSIRASVLACSLAFAAQAKAHVCMVEPASRVGANCSAASPQKVGPCGINERGANPSVFRPGQTITVRLDETIGHPSHYRIAFNPNGDAFEDPTSKDDKNGAHPFVLKDNISDETVDDVSSPTVTQSVQVTLPNVLCETCTLQLIQVMYDKSDDSPDTPDFGGNDGPGGNRDDDDIYYACADIALRGEPVSAGQDAGASPSDASVSPGSDAGDAGTAGGGTSAGGTASAGGTPPETQPPGVDSPDDGGCACSVSDPSPRYGNLFGMSLVALGLLARRRRQHRLMRSRRTSVLTLFFPAARD